ncbi:MAG: hypothetical protein P8O69_06735 [Amylibacter sp.]|nr:hypothetical protein [Amylibacter sp.]
MAYLDAHTQPVIHTNKNAPIGPTPSGTAPIALTFDILKQQVSKGIIDTVFVMMVDMQGQLMGKPFFKPLAMLTKHSSIPTCHMLQWATKS